MKKIIQSTSILAVLFVVGCASTGNHEPFTYSKTKTAEFDDVEYVCKTERITGSHMTRQVCWTKDEYASLEKETEAASQRLRKKSLQANKNNQGFRGQK